MPKQEKHISTEKHIENERKHYIYIHIYICMRSGYQKIPKGHSKFATKNWKHLENTGTMQKMKRNQRAVVQDNSSIFRFSCRINSSFSMTLCCSFCPVLSKFLVFGA
jgi:hypothetical protein